MIGRWLHAFLAGMLVLLGSSHAVAALPETIARVKPSVVVVGTFNKLRSPQFVMRGTGFAVRDGSLIVTNAHVVSGTGLGDTPETLMVLSRNGSEVRPQEVHLLVSDVEHDLAVLRLAGPPLPPLALRPSESVREGQAVAFTGFPIGGALGFSPVTHRGIISSITPIALPGGNARELRDRSIRRLRSGAFLIFQLDATAYPGNSGGPLYDAESGEVLGVINMVFVKATKEAILEKPSGISYAIPAGFLLELLDTIKP
ncbi:MAG: serine protease [Rhodocyclaceae bacterium]|jgi:S1-C subfamily serine protease|nr:serine protease [Rhodocyclaceae bacterium]